MLLLKFHLSLIYAFNLQVVVAWRGNPILRQGVLPQRSPATSDDDTSTTTTPLGTGPIAQVAIDAADSPNPYTYLPNLPTLPGRVEFTTNGLVPPNTQSLVVLAFGGTRGLLLLGSDRARAFTQSDLATAVLLAEPLDKALAEADGAQ